MVVHGQGFGLSLGRMRFFILFLFGLVLNSRSFAYSYETVVRSSRSLLLEKSSSEIVIDQEVIQKLRPQNVVDLLQKTAGISGLQAQGATKSLFLRGSGADQVLFLLDGVILNDPTAPSAGADLTFLDPSIIEEIRIWTPTESILWGGGALGGVISIRTKISHNQAFAQGGSDQSQAGHIGLALPDLLGWTSSVFISVQNQMGKSVVSSSLRATEKDQSQMFTILGKAKAQVEKSEFQITGLHNQGFEELDGMDLSGPRDDLNAKRNQRQSLLSLRHFYQVMDSWELTQDLHWQNLLRNHQDPMEASGGTSLAGRFDSQSLAYWNQNLLKQDWGYLDFGFDLHQEQAHIHEEMTAFPYEVIHQSQGRGGIYIRPQFQLSSLKLSPGARCEDQGGQRDHLTSFRVEYQFSPQVTSDFELTQGVKKPSLYQKYYPQGGNPQLISEKVDHFNAGLTLLNDENTSESKFRFLLFSQRWKNLITYDLSLSKYLNQTRAQSDGFEVSYRRNWGAWASHMGWTETWTKDDQGLSLLRRPRSVATVDLSHESESWMTSVVGVWKSSREDSVIGQRYQLASYGSWSLLNQYEFRSGYRLNVDFRNIFDHQVSDIYGYTPEERSLHIGLGLRL